MKITKKWGKMLMAGMLGTVLTFGLLFSSCGGGSGGGGAGSTGSTTTYTGSSGEGAVEITLTPQSAKSSGIAAIDYVDYVYIPAERSVVSGTTYSYTIKIGGVSRSSGTAKVTSVTLTFTSSSGKTFSATISSGGLTSLTIKPDSGTEIAVASLTEATSGGSTGTNPFAGTWKCTHRVESDEPLTNSRGQLDELTMTFTTNMSVNFSNSKYADLASTGTGTYTYSGNTVTVSFGGGTDTGTINSSGQLIGINGNTENSTLIWIKQ
ncbi:hypothetical protein AGMMS50212_17060 [Spirochaetia bacterium]|nr:hypothetical protein AGMMS50212_17060 [Spirochaetia bacterium]